MGVAVRSGHGRASAERRFRCTNKVQRCIRCLGGNGRILFGSPVCIRNRREGVAIRITLRCASSFRDGLLAFAGGVRACRNKARRTNFGATLAHIVGSCTHGTKVLGRGSSGLSNRSIHRNLATIISVGRPSPRFRNRAGAGLKGSSTHTMASGVFSRAFDGFVLRGPSITGHVIRGNVLTTGTHMTTGETHRIAHGGGKLRVSGLPNGLTSGADGSPRVSRLFVIRKSSTKNSTGRKHSHLARTVLPVQNGVLGIRGTDLSQVLTGRRVHSLFATLNAKFNRSFSIRGTGCRGLVVVASTSISNTRVEALLLALFCHFVGPVVRGNCICVTRPPLCRIHRNGVVHCVSSSRRLGRILKDLRPDPGPIIRHCGNLNRVSTRRL